MKKLETENNLKVEELKRDLQEVKKDLVLEKVKLLKAEKELLVEKLKRQRMEDLEANKDLEAQKAKNRKLEQALREAKEDMEYYEYYIWIPGSGSKFHGPWGYVRLIFQVFWMFYIFFYFLDRILTFW